MAEEGGKTIALVILGIVSVVAIIGLVLLFRGGDASGQAAYGTFGREPIGECGMYNSPNARDNYVYQTQPVFNMHQYDVLGAEGWDCQLY